MALLIQDKPGGIDRLQAERERQSREIVAGVLRHDDLHGYERPILCAKAAQVGVNEFQMLPLVNAHKRLSPRDGGALSSPKRCRRTHDGAQPA